MQKNIDFPELTQQTIQGRRGAVNELHLGSKLFHKKSRIFFTLNFEMLFLNSKFHEIRQLGPVFIYGGAGAVGNELHLGSKFFFGVIETIFIQQIFPKTKN